MIVEINVLSVFEQMLAKMWQLDVTASGRLFKMLSPVYAAVANERSRAHYHRMIGPCNIYLLMMRTSRALIVLKRSWPGSSASNSMHDTIQMMHGSETDIQIWCALVRHFNRGSSYLIVAWPTTSCFADWLKRRHVTLSIIECSPLHGRPVVIIMSTDRHYNDYRSRDVH